MAINNIIITVSSPDRPGIIQAVSRTVLSNAGNWAESSFSILANVFVGIVRIEIDENNVTALKDSLNALKEKNISVNYTQTASIPEPPNTSPLLITLEANDREGIIEEITSLLANQGVNIVNLETRCESASMAGYELFSADIEVRLPSGFSQQQLQTALENVSEDLVVSLDDAI